MLNWGMWWGDDIGEHPPFTRVERDQIQRLLDAVRDVLGDDCVGAYLQGSAVLDGLRPHSDIDVLVVASGQTSPSKKRRLVEHLLVLSGTPRPIELTVVVETEIRPWRYPAPFDFQYGEWLRGEFESGNLEPWPEATNPDLAALLTMVLLGDRPLWGPPPAQILDPVPTSDYLDAVVRGIEPLLDDLDWDTRNVVLTLSRTWATVATECVHSKDGAAAWALPRLPQEYQEVLERARAIYLGDQEDRWDDIQEEVRGYTAFVVAAIRRLHGGISA